MVGKPSPYCFDHLSELRELFTQRFIVGVPRKASVRNDCVSHMLLYRMCCVVPDEQFRHGDVLDAARRKETKNKSLLNVAES